MIKPVAESNFNPQHVLIGLDAAFVGPLSDFAETPIGEWTSVQVCAGCWSMIAVVMTRKYCAALLLVAPSNNTPSLSSTHNHEHNNRYNDNYAGEALLTFYF